MYCSKCGQTIANDARFCGNCGQPTQPPVAAAPPGELSPVLAPAAAGPGGYAEPAAAAAGRGLLARIKNILLTPGSEWPVIATESSSIGKLYIGYAIPLAAFAAVMTIVHLSVVGVSLPFAGAFRTPVAIAAPYMVMSFVFGLIGLFIEALIINALAPTFSGQRSLLQALKTAAYAFTPVWLSTAFGLLPSFSTLLQLLAGIYGLYLLYKGLSPVMRSPPEKSFGYTATIVIVTLLVGLILGIVMFATGGMTRLAGLTGTALPGTGLFPSQSTQLSQEQGAATVGNVIGGMLGTDDKGKAGLSAALSNLAKAGEQMQSQQDAAAAQSAAQSATATPVVPATPEAAQQAADSAQNAGAAVGGLLTALGGALGGNHRVDPVSFQSLKALLPASLPGMQRINAQGSQQQAVGVKSSSASAQYQGTHGDQVEIKIADMSAVSGLMDLAGALNQNSESESDSGYEKDTTINGRSVHMKYDKSSRHGELSVILAKRFEVDVSGDATDMSTLVQDLTNVDLDRLEAMKDAGAQPR